MHFLSSGRSISRVMVLVFLAALQMACVTTTDSVFTQKENKSEAVDTYVQLGLAYIERNDYDRARKHLARALAIDPNNAGALAALGLVFQNDGEPSLAEKNFKRSIELDPTFTRGKTYYAAYLYSEGRYQEAYDQFKQASNDTEFEGRAQIFRNMAFCANKLNDRTLTYQAYEKSLVLNRSQPSVILTLVGMLIEDKNYQKAQQYFNNYVGMVRSSSVTHSSTSLYYGIQLARYYQDNQQESGYAMLLKTLYGDSIEYKKYRQMIANE